jgi:general secretion pathway protein C
MALGHLEGFGQIYLHVVVDTFGSVAFGKIANNQKPETAVDLTSNRVLPFYREHDFPILAVLTDRDSPFTGDELHPYESLLALNEIEHRLSEKGITKTNGFLERFNRTASEEFLADAMQEKSYQELKEVQADFDVWLERYNAERPYFGYPNMGSTPMEMFRVAKQPAPVDSGVKLAPPKTLALRKAPERYTRSRWLFHLVNLLLLALLVNFGFHAMLKFRDTKPAPESAPAAAPAVAAANSPAETRPMTAYQTIWLRDLFGTSKTEVPEPKEDPSIEKLALAQKSLGLKLVGTVVADDPMISRAIIDNRKTREQEAYREGDNAGKVRIKKILRNKVVITTAKGDELLTIEPEEFGKGRQTLRAQQQAAAQPPAAQKPSAARRQPATVRGRSRVSRQDVEEALANPEEVMGELNISQHMQNEQPSGFRVTGFKSNSILARLGLRNGDVVTDVDGEPVSGPEQAEELFERLVEGGTFAIKIQRRRRPRMLRFNIE